MLSAQCSRKRVCLRANLIENWKFGKKLTEKLPEKEKYNLVSQMQRTAISIVSNISEGVGRNTKKDIGQFMYVARGSVYELETQIYLCIDLGYFKEAELQHAFQQIEKVRKLLSGFINYLQKSS